jgi:hypothetical protein
VQNDWDTTVRDGWSGNPAEYLLQLHGEHRRLDTVVRESHLGARWDPEPFRCEFAEPGCRGPWQQSPERRSHVDAGKIARASHRGKLGTQPFVKRGQECLVVDRRPRRSEVGVAEREPLP